MERILRKVGNSVALFIDKPLRDMLRIDAGSMVILKTDGNRLLIEPTGAKEGALEIGIEPWTDPRYRRRHGIRNEADAKLIWRGWHVINELHDEYGMTDEQFERMYGITYPDRRFETASCVVRRALNSRGAWATPELDGLARVDRCYAEVKAGKTLAEAIEIACTQLPEPRVDS